MLLLPAAIALAALPGPGQAAPPIAYQPFKYGKNHFHMVKANLASPQLRAEMVHSNYLLPVWHLIAKRQPIAAITGTFFAPGQEKAVADILVRGNLVARGSRGTAIGVDKDGGIKIFDQPFGYDTDWLEYDFGLRGAIRVIKKGKVNPNPKAQKFKDKRLWGRAARTGVGITKHGKVVFIATKNQVTLSELGKAMKSRGVIEAVALDGGSSTCLYYNGNMIVNPRRKLCNLLVISVNHVAATPSPATIRTSKSR